MKKKDGLNGSAYQVRDITPGLFIRKNHDFFDAWAAILTPVENLVLDSIIRAANVSTGISTDWWSVPSAARKTGLNPKTVRAALSALRRYRITPIIDHPGKPPEIHINQSVIPPDGLTRPRQNRTENLRRPLPATGRGPLPATGRGPLPATGSTPLPATGRGPLPATGSTPLPATGTTSYTPRDLGHVETRKKDDDEGTPTPTRLISELEEWGLVIDVPMAERMATAIHDARPDIRLTEVLEIVRDVLPGITNRKGVDSVPAYLTTTMVRRCIGPTFEIYRKRARQKAELRERTSQEEKALIEERKAFWEREQAWQEKCKAQVAARG